MSVIFKAPSLRELSTQLTEGDYERQGGKHEF